MAVLVASAALFLSVVGSSLISVASALDTATLSITGAPQTGTNTIGVQFVVPSGDPVPTAGVTVADSGAGSCNATLSSGDAITYTGSCNISGETAGETVSATYAGDANYSPATSTNTLTVAKAAQAALALTSTSGTFGTPLTLTSSGGTGTGVVSYSVTDAGTAGCSISGGALSATSAGTCTVTATKAADSNYNAISSGATPVNISAATQAALAITPVTGTYNTPLALTTTGGSGTGAVTFALTAAGTAGCSVTTAGALTETSAGSCTVTATKAASGGFDAASSPATTITINPAAQAALTITPVTGTYNTPLALTTTGGSGSGAVTFALTAAGTAACSVTSAGALTETSAGTCTVTATKAASTDYNAVSSAATTITINPAAQAALTVTSVTGTYNSPLTLTVTGGSDSGAVTYAVVAGTAGCSVTGGVLIATNAGTCTVTATMAANTDYNAVSSAATTITIGKINQAPLTITPTTTTFNTVLALGVSGGSDNGAVTYSLDSAGTANCSISSGVLSAPTVGTCAVTATMAGNTNYNPVSSPSTTITILRTAQAPLTITSTSGVLNTPLTLAVSGGSDNGAVTYAIVDAGSAGCSISNGALSATSVGTCSVTATMAGNTNYNPVSSPSTTITLVKTGQAATISSKGNAQFIALAPASFTFALAGTPSPIVTTKGALPAGLTLTNNGNGTETISGFTALLALGKHRVTLVATNGIGSPANRTLAIVVGFAPVLVSSASATFTVGNQNSFAVDSLAYPADSIRESGTLPHGVTFVVGRDGSARLSGLPGAGALGVYHFSVAARNSFGTSSQAFKLTVGQVPAFTSGNSATFPVGVPTVFHVSAGGVPRPTITERGNLPKGLRFVGGSGTATLAGTPVRGTSGSYTITFIAGKGSALSATQIFTLVVAAAASFKSADKTTFTVGDATVFIVAATGSPSPSVTLRGTLPAGVSFQGGNGTGILSGTPAKGTKGTYRVTLVASGATQNFTLVVAG